MAMDILSYERSILSMLLKIIVPFMFVYGTYLFYKAQRKYGGNLKKIAYLLMWGGVAGFLASAFRLSGDFFLQWKWGESVMFLFFAVISVLVAYLVYTKFIEIARAFGIAGGEEP